MDSFFFNAPEQRCSTTYLYKNSETDYIKRIDISNGLICMEISLEEAENFTKTVDNFDRMIIISILFEGNLVLNEHTQKRNYLLTKEHSSIYTSAKQNFTLSSRAYAPIKAFIIFIADFFIQRYLVSEQNEPIDYLYQNLQNNLPFTCISTLPIDALSEYLIKKINVSSLKTSMMNISTEHKVIELLLHLFSQLDVRQKHAINDDEMAIAQKAKHILIRQRASPPTIAMLAHQVSSNEFKLKKAFKKTFNTTIYAYVQKIRLEEANRLLRDRAMSVGEVARKVGYKHQGNFSALFFHTYGIYPKDLLKK